jgi:hypothetical protein
MHIFSDGVYRWGRLSQLIEAAPFLLARSLEYQHDCLGWIVFKRDWTDLFVDLIIVIVLLQRLWLYTILNATQCSTDDDRCRCTRERLITR